MDCQSFIKLLILSLLSLNDVISRSWTACSSPIDEKHFSLFCLDGMIAVADPTGSSRTFPEARAYTWRTGCCSTSPNQRLPRSPGQQIVFYFSRIWDWDRFTRSSPF